MNKIIHSVILAGIGLFLFSSVNAAENAPNAHLPAQHLTFLKAHCFDCHDSETREGKVDLETLPLSITTLEQAEIWQKVLNALNAGEMPPEEREQPGNDEKADFLDDLAQTMVAAQRALSDSGGKITMRRLNRREYQNTIEHLLGVQVDASTLPADGGSGTFDTVGASQFISSDQIEQYLKLGRSAIDELFEREAALAQETKVFRVEPEKTVNVANLEAIKKMEENLKLLTPWMAAVDKAVKAPENETIMAELRKKHPDIDKGPYRIYRLSKQLKGVPDLEHFGGDPDSAMNFYQLAYHKSYKSFKYYAELPHNDRGTYLRLHGGSVRLDISPSENELPPGKYHLRFRAGIVEGSPPERHFIEIGHPQQRNQVPADFAGAPLSSHQVTGTIDKPQVIETTVEIGVDTPKAFGIQERQPKDYGARTKRHYAAQRENGHGNPPALWVDWIELEGPIKGAGLTQSNVHRVEPEKTINPANEKEIEQIEDSYARFTRWQKGVDKAAATPANQAKIAEIRKTDRLIDHPVRFYAYADRLEGTPNPKDFGFGDSKKAAASHPEGDRANLAYHKYYAALPHRDRGTYLKVAHGTGRVIISPKDLPPGNYVMRVRAGAVKGSPASRHFIQVGHPQRQIAARNWGLEGRAISSHQVTGTMENPETIEIPLEVGSKTPREFAIQEKQPNNGNLKALWDAHNALKKENGYGHPPAIWIDWIELEGPHVVSKTNARSPLQAILAKHLGNPKRQRGIASGTSKSPSLADASGYQECARAVLSDFAETAFRGAKPDPEFIDRLANIFASRRKGGDSFDTAIRLPLSIILASPGFLYLNEPNDTDERRQLTDRELAVRMAYFLWSAPPDQELLDLAKQQKLSQPEILRQQVNRLLADSPSDEFVAGFVHQWLDMERLDFFQFDTTLHRDFDESTRSAARQEVYQSFAHLLRQGIAEGNPKRERGKGLTTGGIENAGRIGKLLKSDYVFVNGLLANYYGIDGVTGDQFQRVSLPEDSPRGGLLGMAAIHAMGSDGIESSPVERGAWVLRYILNDPPPPAPPNVPQISRLKDQVLTTRERLLAHQEEAQCASCHRKIDPIGFGLENFNAAGKWRTEDSDGSGRKKKTWKIDASGAFHKGPTFNDYHELRDLIAEREDHFARGFTEHLIEYALGRPFGFTDEDLVNEIVSSVKGKQFTLSEFVHSLVQSKAFRTK